MARVREGKILHESYRQILGLIIEQKKLVMVLHPRRIVLIPGSKSAVEELVYSPPHALDPDSP